MDKVKPMPDVFCPYVGLQPYREVDQDYFFGRERDSRVITSNLYAAPLTVLYGPSGVGKSSVLRAGVMPRLLASPRIAVVIFDGWANQNLLYTLKAKCLDAITAVMGNKDVQFDLGLPLDEFLFSAMQSFDGTLVIILDQFEEYFLYHPEKDNSFDAEFARVVNREEIDTNFLITLREDALSKLDRFRARIPNMLGNSLRLRHLDAAAARDAIRKPLEVYGQRHPNEPSVSIEDALVEELIQQIQVEKLILGQGGRGVLEEASSTDSDVRIEAPFLQLVLTRLWGEEIDHQGSHVLRLATLNALGGAGQIVRTHMDAAMNILSWEELETAASIFRYMITPSGTKIAYTIADLEYYAKLDRPIQPVLEKLAQRDVRIMRAVTSPSEPGIVRYEIYHDVLAPAVLDWRARYESGELLLIKGQSNESLRAGLAQVSHFYEQLASRKSLLLSGLAILLASSVIRSIPLGLSLLARLILPLLLNSVVVSILFNWVVRRTMIARRRGLASLIISAGGMGAILGLVFTLNLIALLSLKEISRTQDMLGFSAVMLFVVLFETPLALGIILATAWIAERLFKSYTSGFYWSFVIIVIIMLILTILRQPVGLIGLG
jgi:hypothetical protein